MRARGMNLLRNLGTVALCAAVMSTSTSFAAQSEQTTPPAPAAPRSVKFPQPVETTLPNGLRVVAVEHTGVPVVTAELMIRSGGEVDPANLSGLADVTAGLLTKGTARRTAPQIAEAIDALGGSLNSDADWDVSTATVTVMSSKIGAALEILSDVVRNPVFSDEEIDRYRQQAIDDLTVTMAQPGPLATLVAARVLYGNAPYGHPLAGTPESLGRMKRDDIVKLHDEYYRPDNAILVIGGDISPATAFKLATELFGNWKRPATPLPVSAGGAGGGPSATARVVVIDKPDAGQAAVLLVRPGIKRSDAEYYRAIVANTVLGGGYSARLNQEIRIKRGLSYGASSRLDTRRDVGPFIASTQTKNESGAEVAGLLLAELTRLGSEAVAVDELTPRQATLTGNFARALETSQGLVGRIGNFALYGLDLNTANSFIAAIQKVNSADVQQLASTRLDAKGASIIIVGNASKFVDDLKKQFPNVEVIPVDKLNLESATLVK